MSDVVQTGESRSSVESRSGFGGGWPTGVQVLAVSALLVIAFAGLNYIQSVFAPLFLALTLVLTVRPISRSMVRRGAPPWLAATVAFLALLVIFVGIVSILVWSFTPVPQTLVNYAPRFEATMQSLQTFLESRNIKTDDLAVYANQLNFNSVISWAWSLLDSVRSLSGLVAIVVIALFFITIDTTVMKSRRAVISQRHSHLAAALGGFERRVRHYWIISTIFGFVVAVIDVFVLGALGVPLPLTWGVWAFITNYIPNVGFLIGVLPPMLMGLLDSGWTTLVWVIVLYSVINVVIQTFIQPKFTGDVVGLSPSVTFVSLVMWTVVVGLLGSILAVPLTLFFKAVLIDSDPRSRWIDVFFVSEADTRRRKEAGLYDEATDVEVDTIPFRYEEASLPELGRNVRHEASVRLSKLKTPRRPRASKKPQGTRKGKGIRGLIARILPRRSRKRPARKQEESHE